MDWLYEWMKTLAFYYIFVSVITNALPDTKYQTYVKFFLGMLLIVLLLNPILDLLRLTETLDGKYLEELIRMEWDALEEEVKVP